MFFAETLGPALTPLMAHDLFKHVKIKLGGRASATLEEVRAAVADYLRIHGVATTPETAIGLLARHGKLRSEASAPGNFNLAA